MDWLEDVGMVVNSLKTEAMYFSKHDQVGLKIKLTFSEIQVGTTMRVLGVMYVLCSRHLAKWRFAWKTPRKAQIFSLTQHCRLYLGGGDKNAASNLELHSLANMLTPSQMELHHTWVFFTKSFCCESSKRFVHPCNEPSIFKERTKTTMVTKNWTSKFGLSRFPNNAHEAFQLVNGEISKEKISTFKKKTHVAILSKVD